ncbi:MAG: response regulator [Blautia marasmi]
MRLLLAEDEKELANALAAVLKHNNYSIDVVYNGADAYDWAQAAAYDGMILDIMMPGMSGLGSAGSAEKASCTVPILLLTAKRRLKTGSQDLIWERTIIFQNPLP